MSKNFKKIVQNNLLKVNKEWEFDISPQSMYVEFLAKKSTTLKNANKYFDCLNNLKTFIQAET